MSDDADDFWRAGNGVPFLGEPLINPRTGQLQDFRRFPGDNPPDYFKGGAAADRWGSRILMQINQVGTAKVAPTDPQTFVDIRTLEATYPINVQLRFALANPDGTPVLPFSTVWPFFGTPESLSILIRRTSDALSMPTEDRYFIDNAKVFPWDTFTSRTFTLDATFGGTNLPASVWVEVIATKVTDIATRSKIEGWGVLKTQKFVAAQLGSVQLLDPRADRRQFIICNTSTTGNLYINFQNGVFVGPPPVAVMVLPKNSFATYESPLGGWTGTVHGGWDDDTDGGALVTEGVFGSTSAVSQ